MESKHSRINVCDINNNKYWSTTIEGLWVCVCVCVHHLNGKQIILTNSQVLLKHFTYRERCLVMCIHIDSHAFILHTFIPEFLFPVFFHFIETVHRLSEISMFDFISVREIQSNADTMVAHPDYHYYWKPIWQFSFVI